MKLFIITGASGGLGLSLTQLALSQGDLVVGISRRSILKHENFFSIKHDLSKVQGLGKKLDMVLGDVNLRRVKSVHLINNAAGIEPIGAIGKFSTKSIQHHIQLNLTAPISLSNYVIQKFKNKATIINIVSGAAVRSIGGWSLYCSSKSGLRMFTDCLVTEGVKSLSFSPGIMDTSMQATIRKQKINDFDRVQEFRSYKDKNLLLSSGEVGSLLMNLLMGPDPFKKVHYSVHELQ